jgi:hypothetical protein
MKEKGKENEQKEGRVVGYLYMAESFNKIWLEEMQYYIERLQSARDFD